MTTAPISIETPRLLLRLPQLGDFEPFAAFAADAETMRFIGGPQARHTAWRSFMTAAGAWSLQGFAMFSVIERSTGRWVGRVGPWMPDGWPGTEVGWGIVRDCWGTGYATEAAAAAIDWAFASLRWTEVIHVIDVGNIASQRVAEKLRSGNRGRGRLPPPYDEADVEIWGQSRAEWLRKRERRPTPIS
jgi:RimJ/RimL family protein N-acetyltransferase